MVSYDLGAELMQDFKPVCKLMALKKWKLNPGMLFGMGVYQGDLTSLRTCLWKLVMEGC